jgi:flagellar protein FliO/FliZ
MQEFNENNPIIYASGTPDPGVAFSWWGLLGYIVLFLLLLVAALWVIRRLNRTSARSFHAPWARVLDRQYLAGQQYLYLVEIAGKLMVLGGSDHCLTKIEEIHDADAAAEIMAEIANTPLSGQENPLALFLRRFFYGKRRTDPFAAELQKMLEDKNYADKP